MDAEGEGGVSEIFQGMCCAGSGKQNRNCFTHSIKVKQVIFTLILNCLVSGKARDYFLYTVRYYRIITHHYRGENRNWR